MPRGDGVRKRGGDSWEIRCGLGWNPKKKAYDRASVTVHGTKTQALRKRRELLTQLDQGGYIDPTRQTAGEYLRNWLAHCENKSLSASTVQGYQGVVDRYLEPSIGSILLQRLTPIHLEVLYAELLQSGGRNGKGISQRSVLHVHRILHSALKRAVRLRLLATNPADAVEPPRPTRKEMCALDELEVRTLLDLLKSEEDELLYQIVLLAVNTGMRRGELLALRWADIDMETCTIAVTRSLQITKKHGLVFKEPKTVRSRRTLAVPATAMRELRAYKVRHAEQRLLLGPAYEDSDLVFCEADGRPLSPDKVSSQYAAFRKEHGVKARLHDMRHTHASLLLKAGESVKVVADRLGHSTAMLTLDTYAHVLPGMDAAAAERFDGMLQDAKASANN